MWQARFHQSLPQIVLEHPKARWLFLTLTVPNCPIGELGATLTAMNAGWNRLQARKELKAVIGWVRTTEVTRSAIGEAHPHFHVLLMDAQYCAQASANICAQRPCTDWALPPHAHWL